MTEDGTLSIMRRGLRYQVRYASNNPDDKEHHPRLCSDEAYLRTLLYQLGLGEAAITQVCADVQKVAMAVLLIAVSAEQLQTCFRPAA